VSNKLLILDLDETLIHATSIELPIKEEFKFDKYYVYKRPHLDWFLREIVQHFKVGIWSSADDIYVNEIVRQIIPEGLEFEIIWGRSRCSYKRDIDFDEYFYEKRLDKLKKCGFRLENIIIVDDTPEKSRANYGNAVHIKEFNGDLNDNELKYLHDYLLTLKDIENIRTVEKRYWCK
jgi:carboxy-terminal domain RNA polymerase II polypeptide A small phosphatase